MSGEANAWDPPSGHDVLCHAAAFEYHDPECCDCDLIGRVRAAERERVINDAASVEAVARRAAEVIHADLRAQVEALTVWAVERRTAPMAPKERVGAVLLVDVLALLDGGDT